MPWGAVIGAGASLIGAAIKGGGKGANSTTTQGTTEATHTPWGPQGTAITNALQGATNVYQDRANAGPYQGQLYQNINGMQDEAARGALGYAGATGTGPQAIGMANTVGVNGTNQIGQAMYNANHTAANGIGGPANGALTGALTNIGSGQQGAVNAGLSSSLNSAATAGADSIGSYNSGLSGVMQSAMADPTHQLAGNAQEYMNSGATQQMLANANGQISRTLNESTLPGLNRQAAMGGSLNSSRAGMAEAMANTDASLSMGNADAQIMNNAYNTGLSTAAQQHTAGLNTAASAASAGLSGNSNLALGAGNQDISATQTQIGAANMGLSQQTQRDTANTAAQLSGNNQLIQGVNTGLNANQQGQNLAMGNANLLSGAGGLIQGADQGQLNANHQAWQNTNQYQQGVLNDYMANATRPQGFYNASQADKSTKTSPGGLPQAILGAGVGLSGQFGQGGALRGMFGAGDGSTFGGSGEGQGGILGVGGNSSIPADNGAGFGGPSTSFGSGPSSGGIDTSGFSGPSGTFKQGFFG